MKRLMWIDSRILQFFATLTKKFNWLTGKDNFFLAKFSLLLYCVSVSRFEPIGVTVWSGLLLLGLIFTVERSCVSEQVRAAKELDLWIGLVVLRLATWVDLVRHFNPLWIAATVLLAAMLYFLSVERPPFSRSQAWEELQHAVRELAAPLAREPLVTRS
jgi:hypothetical protein